MRPAILNSLFAETASLKGVGATLEKPLARLDLTRIRDLVYHLPSGFIDRRRVASLDEAGEGEQIVIRLTPAEYRASRGRGPFRVMACDDAGNFAALIFFGRNPGWAKKLLPLGETRIIAGKLEIYGESWQIVHPDHILAETEAHQLDAREPVYPLSEGLTQNRIGALVDAGLQRLPELEEWIEPSLLNRQQWPGWRDSLMLAHAGPHDRARDRLAYDEILAGQLAFALIRQSNRRRKGLPLQGDGSLTGKLPLPFSLTGAQRRTIAEIAGDMAQAVPMLRLLQGDVGSGKTVVAVMAMLAAVEAGAQAAMLAPTEILARQHYETVSKMLSGLPVSVAVLTGRDKGKAREATLMGIADGSIHIVIGTHALFQDAVSYRNLGLAIIDEQHKFGVGQRLLLQEKGRVSPHVLAMTATPIPRTLTLSHYGEMEVSRLDELPPGRQAIETRVIASDRIDEIVAGLERHIAGGGQAYWVCPLVAESDTSDLAAAELRAAALAERFPGKVSLVHGQMPVERKDAMMADFAAGRTALLVATTVIEVGVDVPNATLMIVEAAERFGLAQLHQLRGRVGRGSEKSICLLLRGHALSETARARLALMRESQDGFHIAEEDLRLRGGGELLGTRQSGESGYRVATPEQVQRLIGIANDDARLLLDRDGGLESARGEAARVALYLFERDYGARLLRGG
ncbi:MAG: ATP-dependent DNA helicase RecG [Blastomonas sp.]